MLLLPFTLAPISIFAAASNHALSQLAGYRVVPIHYGPPNKMIMSFRINGRRTKRRGLVSLRDVTPMDPQELTRVR
jgi:hypothetical protein